jgi:hypothetical protein
MTHRIAIMLGILLLQAPLTHGQTQPQFEVASIKAANPSAARPGRLGAVPVVTSSGRLTARNAKADGTHQRRLFRRGLSGLGRSDVD